MEIPKHWTFIFEGVGENYNYAGDVITVADGEIIGTWAVLDGAFYTFTPSGATEHLFLDPFLGRMCGDMREWLETRDVESQASFTGSADSGSCRGESES